MFKIVLIFSINIFLVRSIPWSKNADLKTVNDVAFHKLGTYRGFTDEGSEYQKSYFFTRFFHASWAEARSFCSSYGLEFLTMETLEEAKAVLSLADNNIVLRALTSHWIYIDGLGLTIKSPTDWYWTNTGKQISYAIPWRPGTPNNQYGNENCLSFGKASINEKFGFDDSGCGYTSPIACQRIEFSIP